MKKKVASGTNQMRYIAFSDVGGKLLKGVEVIQELSGVIILSVCDYVWLGDRNDEEQQMHQDGVVVGNEYS